MLLTYLIEYTGMKAWVGSLIFLVMVAGCGDRMVVQKRANYAPPVTSGSKATSTLSEVQKSVLQGAKDQLVSPAVYDASYRALDYPGGDVDSGRGACTDVVIRALREVGIDLQKEIYEDSARGGYPRIVRRDRNIDHRRCPNLRVWMRKNFEDVDDGKWEPGDIVFWKLTNGLDHVGIVSDVKMGNQWEMIHNISGVKQELVDQRWVVVDVFRVSSD